MPLSQRFLLKITAPRPKVLEQITKHGFDVSRMLLKHYRELGEKYLNPTGILVEIMV